MAPRRKRRPGSDPLEAYRRVRKPLPPPEQVIPDKRRRAEEREAELEARRHRGRAPEDG